MVFPSRCMILCISIHCFSLSSNACDYFMEIFRCLKRHLICAHKHDCISDPLISIQEIYHYVFYTCGVRGTWFSTWWKEYNTNIYSDPSSKLIHFLEQVFPFQESKRACFLWLNQLHFNLLPTWSYFHWKIKWLNKKIRCFGWIIGARESICHVYCHAYLMFSYYESICHV